MFGRLYNNFQAAEAVLFKNAGHSRIAAVDQGIQLLLAQVIITRLGRVV